MAEQSAEEIFKPIVDDAFEVGQFSRMGMWFVKRTRIETVALAATQGQAEEIKRAFQQAVKKKD